MSDFFPEFEVRDDQAEAIERGLYAIASADGQVHERELALISALLARPADAAALARAPKLSAADLAAILSSVELRALFVKTAILLAYADGSYGAGESKLINEYCKALGVGDELRARLELEVKEHMLGELSHLANTESVAKVAKDLKI